MATYSVRVTTLLANIRHLHVTAHTHAARVVPEATRTLHAAPGPIEATWAAALDTLARHARALEAAEAAYIAEQSDDHAPRAARDTAAEATATTLRQVAGALTAAFGPTAAADYRLDGPMPVRPDSILRRADAAIAQLHAQPRSGAHALFGIDVHTRALAERITNAADPLRAALHHVKREEGELKASLVDRDHAMATASRTYRIVASLLEAFFLAAGEARLANTVRPTQRKARGIDAAAPPVAEDTPEAPVVS